MRSEEAVKIGAAIGATNASLARQTRARWQRDDNPGINIHMASDKSSRHGRVPFVRFYSNFTYSNRRSYVIDDVCVAMRFLSIHPKARLSVIPSVSYFYENIATQKDISLSYKKSLGCFISQANS